MRYLIPLLALLILATPAAAAPALPVEAEAYAPGRVRVEAVAPPGAVELCAAAGERVACAPATPGASVTLELAARGGDTMTVWAGDRPYIVGGTQTVLAISQFPTPGGTAYLPAVSR